MLIFNVEFQEMSNIPTLIEAFNPSTSQILKTGENGIKKPKSSNDYHRKSEQNPSIKPKPQVENYRNHTALKGMLVGVFLLFFNNAEVFSCLVDI